MLKVEKLVTPSPEQWETAIHGMRNAFKSWDKSDSGICTNSEEEKEICYKGCPFVNHWEGEEPYRYPVCNKTYDNGPVFIMGKNDKNLLLNLSKLGTSDRKVLRQLPVIMDIKAPLYWHKQMDQYKVGTVTNAESTMHTMTKVPFQIEDFSVENFLEIDGEETNWLQCTEYEESDLWFDGMENHGYFFTPEEYFKENFINLLNSLRYFYLKTKDKKYWYAINELLPQSYNQTRTWSGNYEVLVSMFQQRFNHKLSEWNDLLVYLYENVPYYGDILEALGLIRRNGDSVEGYDSFKKEWLFFCKER